MNAKSLNWVYYATKKLGIAISGNGTEQTNMGRLIVLDPCGNDQLYREPARDQLDVSKKWGTAWDGFQLLVLMVCTLLPQPQCLIISGISPSAALFNVNPYIIYIYIILCWFPLFVCHMSLVDWKPSSSCIRLALHIHLCTKITWGLSSSQQEDSFQRHLWILRLEL